LRDVCGFGGRRHPAGSLHGKRHRLSALIKVASLPTTTGSDTAQIQIAVDGLGNDYLGGGLGHDVLYGGAGNDLMQAKDRGRGNDKVVGGAGRDRCRTDWIKICP
jgi:hypothetical protein